MLAEMQHLFIRFSSAISTASATPLRCRNIFIVSAIVTTLVLDQVQSFSLAPRIGANTYSSSSFPKKILRSSRNFAVDKNGDNVNDSKEPIELLTVDVSMETNCSDGEMCSLEYDGDVEMDEDMFFLDSVYMNPDQATTIKLSNMIMIIPVVSPVLAYMTYDDVARGFNFLFQILAREQTWVAVDGGAYQAKIIAPAINGIVVPAISILFATLTGNTVTTLRQRQVDIHAFLNCEAGDLRMLTSLVDCYPISFKRLKSLEYIEQYTCRLIAESRSRAVFGSTDSEMNGIISTLNELAGSTPCGEGNCEAPSGTILSESYSAVVRLNNCRSNRITAVQSTFPILHYGILLLLAGSICVAFLLETNQELLIFLNAVQLRILWTMLIGSMSALGVVFYDLSGPFRGSYKASNAIIQLRSIRDTLRVMVETARSDF
mmetsp:Transcript_5412/g.7666  ORF Transcript_5412/g.7666 Transcript_5412/m.7666 type:complete len:432 (-) Transcript_5412:44-1339(-)